MSYVYAHTDPVLIIKAYIRSLPEGRRRGVLNRISKAAGVFPSYLSQIFKGQRTFSQDQAILVAEFMSLNEHETRYFLRTAELMRAQSKRLKDYIVGELNQIRSAHDQISSYVPYEKEKLSEEAQARFYSSWIYAAVRLMAALPGAMSPEQLSQRFGVSEKQIRSIIDFLLRTGLCERKGSELRVGPMHTHLEPQSPFIVMHHSNWRRRAMDRHAHLDPTREVAYSGALTLSEEDALKVRNMVLQFVKEVRAVSDPSPAKELYALGIDWILV